MTAMSKKSTVLKNSSLLEMKVTSKIFSGYQSLDHKRQELKSTRCKVFFRFTADPRSVLGNARSNLLQKS